MAYVPQWCRDSELYLDHMFWQRVQDQACRLNNLGIRIRCRKHLIGRRGFARDSAHEFFLGRWHEQLRLLGDYIVVKQHVAVRAREGGRVVVRAREEGQAR